MTNQQPPDNNDGTISNDLASVKARARESRSSQSMTVASSSVEGGDDDKEDLATVKARARESRRSSVASSTSHTSTSMTVSSFETMSGEMSVASESGEGFSREDKEEGGNQNQSTKHKKRKKKKSRRSSSTSNSSNHSELTSSTASLTSHHSHDTNKSSNKSSKRKSSSKSSVLAQAGAKAALIEEEEEQEGEQQQEQEQIDKETKKKSSSHRSSHKSSQKRRSSTGGSGSSSNSKSSPKKSSRRSSTGHASKKLSKSVTQDLEQMKQSYRHDPETTPALLMTTSSTITSSEAKDAYRTSSNQQSPPNINVNNDNQNSNNTNTNNISAPPPMSRMEPATSFQPSPGAVRVFGPRHNNPSEHDTDDEDNDSETEQFQNEQVAMANGNNSDDDDDDNLIRAELVNEAVTDAEIIDPEQEQALKQAEKRKEQGRLAAVCGTCGAGHCLSLCGLGGTATATTYMVTCVFVTVVVLAAVIPTAVVLARNKNQDTTTNVQVVDIVQVVDFNETKSPTMAPTETDIFAGSDTGEAEPQPTPAPTTLPPTPSPTLVPTTLAPTTMAPTTATPTVRPTPSPTVREIACRATVEETFGWGPGEEYTGAEFAAQFSRSQSPVTFDQGNDFLFCGGKGGFTYASCGPDVFREYYIFNDCTKVTCDRDRACFNSRFIKTNYVLCGPNKPCESTQILTMSGHNPTIDCIGQDSCYATRVAGGAVHDEVTINAKGNNAFQAGTVDFQSRDEGVIICEGGPSATACNTMLEIANARCLVCKPSTDNKRPGCKNAEVNFNKVEINGPVSAGGYCGNCEGVAEAEGLTNNLCA